ncbi:MAG: hypothetical protein JWM78_1606 [Verrucomicrobiaceae bacterium]|nr:hypothetical protein [Verrucomicrobiaceae bacterium]
MEAVFATEKSWMLGVVSGLCAVDGVGMRGGEV